MQDINYGGDGGLYAELIRNRAFQNASSVSAWTAIGGAKLSLKTLAQPLSLALPKSLNVADGSGTMGFSNPGWWGIDGQVQDYTGSFYVKGSCSGNFTASIISSSNVTLGSVDIESVVTPNNWTQHSFVLISTQAANNSNNKFTITYESKLCMKNIVTKKACYLSISGGFRKLIGLQFNQSFSTDV